METFRFKDVKIDNLSFDEIKARLDNNIHNKGYVCLVEASGVIRSIKNPALKQAINDSLISIPDGAPLAWFGRILGSTKIERISGVELMYRVFRDRSGCRHFLLGDTNDTIEKVIKKAKKQCPGIVITGYSPPFKREFDEKDNALMFKMIDASNADFIWVSFGLGKQEKWMLHNHHRINKGIMFGVGAAFKFYIQKLKMPHPLLQRLGMSWISRLVDNPILWISRPFLERLLFIIFFIQELKKVNTANLPRRIPKWKNVL